MGYNLKNARDGKSRAHYENARCYFSVQMHTLFAVGPSLTLDNRGGSSGRVQGVRTRPPPLR